MGLPKLSNLKYGRFAWSKQLNIIFLSFFFDMPAAWFAALVDCSFDRLWALALLTSLVHGLCSWRRGRGGRPAGDHSVRVG
jgi:hypothetical protein